MAQVGGDVEEEDGEEGREGRHVARATEVNLLLLFYKKVELVGI